MSEVILELEPFSEQLICPNCGYTDQGKFCSRCGHLLMIPPENIADQLIKRCMIFGFAPLGEWLALNEEVAGYHDLSFLNTLQGKVLCKEDPPANGLRLQLIFIVDDQASGEAYLKTFVSEFVENRTAAINRINKLPRTQRPASYKFFLDSIEISGIVIKDVPAVSKDIGQFVQKIKIYTKTGVLAGTLKKVLLFPHIISSSFNLNIRLDVAILNYNDGKLYSASHRIYDIVKHQAKIVAGQTKEYTESSPPKSRGKLVEFLLAIADGFRDYFKILTQYIRNPSFFPALIAMRNVIPSSKIVGLYFTGLICSITIPWLLTGGYLNSGNLGLFSNLPPFIGDLAELAVDLLRISITCLILHVVIRLSGRKGSFSTLLLCFLFYESFMQVLERPFRYLTGPLLLNRVNNNFQLQYTIQFLVFSCLSFIAAYFIFPILFSVYKATRRIIGLAYLIVLFFFSFWIGFFNGFFTEYAKIKYGTELDYHGLQIFYKDGATITDVDKLKDFLVSSGFTTGEMQSTQLVKDDSGYIFREVIKSGVKIDPALRDAFSDFAGQLSYKVFNGAIVKIQVCNSLFKTIEEFQMAPGSRLVTYTAPGYSIRYPSSWQLEKGGKRGTVFFIYSTKLSLQVNLLTEDLTDTTISLDGYMKLGETELKKLHPKDLDILKNSRETNNGRAFQQLVYTVENVPDTNKVRVEQYVWLVRNKVYILSCVARSDAFDEDTIAIGELILNSFLIKE